MRPSGISGIKIRFIDSDLKNFFASRFLQGRRSCNSGECVETHSNERKIFTLAHELGHLLLHPDSFLDSEQKEINKQEKEANAFAGYFLMPDDFFRKKIEESKGLHLIDLVFHIKRIFKVSYKAVLTRLIEMKLTDDKIWSNFLLNMRSAIMKNFLFTWNRFIAGTR